MKYKQLVISVNCFISSITAWKVPKYRVFLVRIIMYSDWIRRLISVFSPNTGKYGPEKTPYLDTFHAVYVLEILNSARFWISEFVHFRIPSKFRAHYKILKSVCVGRPCWPVFYVCLNMVYLNNMSNTFSLKCVKV